MTATTQDKVTAAAIARWALVIVAGLPVATRTCRRCQGKGILDCYYFNDFGICRLCGGQGVTPAYTKEQKAALTRQADLEREFAAHLHANRLDRVSYTYPDGTEMRTYVRSIVRVAQEHLRDNAPARYELLLTSLERGRTEAVITALVAYATEHGLIP